MVVDDARSPDADAEHGGVRVADEVAGELDHGADDVTVGDHGHFAAGDDVAVEGEDCADEDVAAREVDADDAVARAIEVDEDRGLAGTGCLAHAHLGDEAVGDELGDEVGDRDAGEPGLAGEVGAAHRTLVEQRLQQQRAVVAAGVLGQHLASLAQRAPRPERATVRGSWGVRRLESGRAALRFR